MDESTIRAEYIRMFGIGDDKQRAKTLSDLRAEAAKAGLEDWARLIDARTALVKDEYDNCIGLATGVVESPHVSAEIRGWTLVVRGSAHRLNGEKDKAIVDFTTVIDDPTSPPQQKFLARVNRGVVYGEKNDKEREIADYTAVIDDPTSRPEEKARARVNRGVVYGHKGEADRALVDLTAVIDDPTSPPQQKFLARVNRGVAYGEKNDVEREIADYTAVVDDPTSSPEEKAMARFNRGTVYGQRNEEDKAIADLTALIEDPASPTEQKVMARVNRGIFYGWKREADKAIADLTAVIEDPASPAEQKARARISRGVSYGQKGDQEKEIADYSAVISSSTSPPEQKAGSLLNRGITYGQKGERDKAIADFNAVIADEKASPELKMQARMQSDILKSETPEAVKASQALRNISLALGEKERREFRNALDEGHKRKRSLFARSQFDDGVSFLLFLRQWNSWTPVVPDENEPSRGGGYFLKHKGVGVVIDPGFDFIQNFAEAGGRLADIQHIIVTHAHNDHSADLDSLLMLFYEWNREPERKGTPAKVNLYLSHGAARKFAGSAPLRSCSYVGRVFVMNPVINETPQHFALSPELSLCVLPAHHDDVLTDEYCVGLGFTFACEGGPSRHITFTSDTGVYRDASAPEAPIHHTYPKPFSERAKADLLVVHIGSIADEELKGPYGEIVGGEKVFRPTVSAYPNHLGLMGTFYLIYDLRPKAVVVSEFGEEMKRIWVKAVKAIGTQLEKSEASTPVFAGDPVVIYNIQTGAFLCHDDLTWHSSDGLRMVETRDNSQGRGSCETHPYLFTKDLVGDPVYFEEKVGQFHNALRERTLPHFATTAKART